MNAARNTSEGPAVHEVVSRVLYMNPKWSGDSN